MPVTIPGFRYERVAVADGVRLNTAIGGAGRPVVLLHEIPCSANSLAVAQAIYAERFTAIAGACQRFAIRGRNTTSNTP